MVKYMVRLNTEEREQLLAFVNTGRPAAAKLLHARILLKADVGAGDCHWTDMEAALARKRRPAGSIANWTGHS